MEACVHYVRGVAEKMFMLVGSEVKVCRCVYAIIRLSHTGTFQRSGSGVTRGRGGRLPRVTPSRGVTPEGTKIL